MDKADGSHNSREKIHSVFAQEKEKKRRKKKDKTEEGGRKEIKADESKSTKRRSSAKTRGAKEKKKTCKSRKAEKEKNEPKRRPNSATNRDGPALYASSSAITLRALLQPIGETLTQISMKLSDIASSMNNDLEASRLAEVYDVKDGALGENESVKFAQGISAESHAQDFLSSLTQKNVVLFSKCGINVDDVIIDDRSAEINNNSSEVCSDVNKIDESGL